MSDKKFPVLPALIFVGLIIALGLGILDAGGTIDLKWSPKIFANAEPEIDQESANSLISFGVKLGRDIERIEWLEWQLFWEGRQWYEQREEQVVAEAKNLI